MVKSLQANQLEDSLIAGFALGELEMMLGLAAYHSIPSGRYQMIPFDNNQQ